jgi:hypothetical protein
MDFAKTVPRDGWFFTGQSGWDFLLKNWQFRVKFLFIICRSPLTFAADFTLIISKNHF